MVQTRSDAPAQTGTATASAAVDTNTFKLDVPKIGDTTSSGDGIGNASLGAGDPKEDLESVKSLNNTSKGSDDSLGLPSCEIHDPLNEGSDTDAGSGGGRGGALNAEAANGDQVNGTTDGAADCVAKTDNDATPDDPNIDAPFTKDGIKRPSNPRDTSPFGTMGSLGHTSTVGNSQPVAQSSRHSHNPTEPGRIQTYADSIGGTSGIQSLGSSAASEVVRAAGEAARRQPSADSIGGTSGIQSLGSSAASEVVRAAGEAARRQSSADSIGGTSGIQSLGSSAASEVVRAAGEAAHRQQGQQHHGQHHQRQPRRHR